jgi:hypothetical protein
VTVNRVVYGHRITNTSQPLVVFAIVALVNVIPSGFIVLICDAVQPVQLASGDCVVAGHGPDVVVVVPEQGAAVVVGVVAVVVTLMHGSAVTS